MIGRDGRQTIPVIVWTEWRLMWRDGRTPLVLAAVLLLFCAMAAAGWRQAERLARERTEAAALARSLWVGQGDKNPHSAAHYGTHIFRPVQPLAFFDPGVDAHAGSVVYLEAHRQNPPSFAAASDSPALAAMGLTTPAEVLQYLAPLAIVLLAYGALARDREDGMLRYVISAGVPPRHLLAGKAVAIAVIVIGALLLGLLLALLASVGLATSVVARRGSSGVALALVAAAYLLYWTGFLGVTLAASARARTSRGSLAVALGIWGLNAMVATPAATSLSERLMPAPMADAFATAVAADIAGGLDGHNPQDQRTQALRDSYLQRYGVTSIDALPMNFAGIALQASEEYGNQVYDRHFAALWDRYEAQARLERSLGIAAPLLAVRAVSMGLAGTDVAAQRDFSRAAEEYRRRLVKTLNDALAYEIPRGQVAVAGAELWARAAPFVYHPRPLRRVLVEQSGGLAILALWCTFGVCAAGVAGRRLTDR